MSFIISSNSCRICLECTQIDLLKSIYDNECDFSSIYEYCTGYAVRNEKTISPINICSSCESQLMEFYKFRKKCETVESILEYVYTLEVNKIDVEQLESITIKMENNEDDVEIYSIKNVMEGQEKKFPEDEQLVSETGFITNPTYDISTVPISVNNDNLYESPIIEIVPQRKSKRKVDKPMNKIYNKTINLNTPKKKARPTVQANDIEESTNTEPSIYNDKEDYRKVLCQQCGKCVSSKGIRNHLLSHVEMKEEDKQYACEICGKKYKYSDALSKHRRVHSDDKRYECQYCNKKFMIWATRRRHIDKEHTGVKRYNCSLCDAQFFDNTSKAKHLKVNHGHYGERRYECNICQKKFIDGHSRNLHMIIHTNERKHVCEICNKRFGRINGLKVHRMMHSGEKNYICPVCSRAFIQNHLLRTHVQKLHPEYELPPPGTIVSQKALQRLNSNANKINSTVNENDTLDETKADSS